MRYIYIGFSNDMVEKMLQSDVLQLAGIITRKNKLSFDILQKVAKEKVPVIFVESKAELREAVRYYGNVLYIMYHFNIIVPGDVAQEYEIFNIHTGDLKTNRGKNPVSWTILLGEDHMTVSVHRIVAEIDKGTLFLSINIPVTEEDDYISLNKKAVDAWPTIGAGILKYKAGELSGEEIENGLYRRGIVESDYTINEDDSLRMVIQKIKSQRGYRGAIVKMGKLKLYVNDYELIE